MQLYLPSAPSESVRARCTDLNVDDGCKSYQANIQKHLRLRHLRCDRFVDYAVLDALFNPQLAKRIRAGQIHVQIGKRLEEARETGNKARVK